jgi:hypothetical protein
MRLRFLGACGGCDAELFSLWPLFAGFFFPFGWLPAPEGILGRMVAIGAFRSIVLWRFGRWAGPESGREASDPMKVSAMPSELSGFIGSMLTLL